MHEHPEPKYGQVSLLLFPQQMVQEPFGPVSGWPCKYVVPPTTQMGAHARSATAMYWVHSHASVPGQLLPPLQVQPGGSMVHELLLST